MNALHHPDGNTLARLRGLLQHTEAQHARAQARLAQQLHGELGALLVAVKLELGWVERRLEEQPDLATKCASLGGLLDAAVENLNRVATSLRPRLLEWPGLWAALEWQAQDFAQRHGLQADVRMHVQAGAELPPSAQDWADAVYRSAEALLDNVARHAQASTLRVRLYVEAPPAGLVMLEIGDDGVGFEPAALAHGWGLLALRERVAHWGGRLTLASAPGGGTTVRLQLPLPQGVS
ncbi:ATP-binding protein [uncultured Azohydromonas sp.]|jgi:Signal transduction histidine kinase|uniref:sensor histidine kinase n=1 Tax=uncultured Azohydromonas sp. TaxID=487342 RepID=UPI002634BC40|nr:ATP-binding protein [uncultured Azohydromonas sp.]